MELFWLENPDIIFKEYNEILPKKNHCTSRQLNALTRLVLLCTLVLLIVQFNYWYIFLLFSLSIIVILAILILEGNQENYSEQDKMNEVTKTSQVNISTSSTTPIRVSTNSTRNVRGLNSDAAKNYEEISEKNTRTNATRLQNSNMAHTNFDMGTNAAYSGSRHHGSVGYYNADNSGLSSLRNLEEAKDVTVNKYYQRENYRREKLYQGYSQKKYQDHNHYLNNSGYEPPKMQNDHYYRDDIAVRRTYNGYAIL